MADSPSIPSSYSADNVSFFNNAVAKNYRMAECWVRVNEFKRQGMLSKWKEELEIVGDELIPDAKMLLSESDYNKFIKTQMKEANNKIMAATTREQRAYWLRIKERVLRLIENKMGRGLVVKKMKDLGRAITLE